MKLPAPAGNAPAEPAPAAPANDLDFGDDSFNTPQDSTAPSDDKPFDDEPFDAGVEADEATDPKKFIEQLTGKLGQSLRQYTDEQGQPDFDLEKFAINSVLSATHTAEMDEEDKNDIIKKVNTSGDNDSEDSGMGSDSNEPSNDNGDSNGDNNDIGGSFDGADEEGLEEIQILEALINADGTKMGSELKAGDVLTGGKGGYHMVVDVTDNGNIYNNVTVEFVGPAGNKVRKTIKLKKDTPYGVIKNVNEECENMFIEPKKMSIFAPEGSPEFMEQNRVAEGLTNSKKMIILDKNALKAKLQETFNQDKMTEPAVEPLVKPITKPDTEPNKPSRRDSPFRIEPDTIPQPDPKALNENLNEGKWADMMKGVRTNFGGPWSIIASVNGRVLAQKIDIRIKELIPAYYEEMKRNHPQSNIHIENGEGMVVWNDKKWR